MFLLYKRYPCRPVSGQGVQVLPAKFALSSCGLPYISHSELTLLQLRVAAPLLGLKKSRRRAPTAHGAVGTLKLMLMSIIIWMLMLILILIVIVILILIVIVILMFLFLLYQRYVEIRWHGFGARSSSIARRVGTLQLWFTTYFPLWDCPFCNSELLLRSSVCENHGAVRQLRVAQLVH